MPSETTTREVVQLLREWSVWHAAFGGASSPDDVAHMVDAAYGPGGFIEEGMAYFADYPKSHIRDLAESYGHLRDAINAVKREPYGMYAWLLLQDAYFGDPGDWRIAERWREVGDYRAGWHDVFVEKVRYELRDKRLYPIWPKPLSQREEKAIEAQHAELYATYQRIRNSGTTHSAAVEQTAALFQKDGTDLSADYVERVLQFRDTLKLPGCTEEGCDRVPYSQNMCMKHYQQHRRRARRNGEAS